MLPLLLPGRQHLRAQLRPCGCARCCFGDAGGASTWPPAHLPCLADNVAHRVCLLCLNWFLWGVAQNGVVSSVTSAAIAYNCMLEHAVTPERRFTGCPSA